MTQRDSADRLVQALSARGVEAHRDTRGNVHVSGHDFVSSPAIDGGEVWEISDAHETLDEAIEVHADAIAAIVQAPGLRAENETLTSELGHYMADSHRLAEERDALAAEAERLRAALDTLTKPLASAWTTVAVYGYEGETEYIRLGPDLGEVALVGATGWAVVGASGPEADDAGKHAADLALIAAGYRLDGGVHPLPMEPDHG